MKSMLKYSLVALAVVGLTACNQEKAAEPNAIAAKVEAENRLTPELCNSLSNSGISTLNRGGWKQSNIDKDEWICSSDYVDLPPKSTSSVLDNNIALYGIGNSKSDIHQIKLVTNINDTEHKREALEQTLKYVHILAKAIGFDITKDFDTAILNVQSFSISHDGLVAAVVPEVSNIVSVKVIFEYNDDIAKQGYGIGASVGRYVAQHMKEQQDLGFPVDEKAIIAGFTESLNGNSAMTDDEIKTTLEGLDKIVNEKRQAQAQVEAEQNQAAGKAFLEQNKAKDGVKTTESGLQYEVLQAGTGDSPKAEDTVKVKYTGKLIDGSVFDSTEKNGGEPIEFPLNRVIPGWTEGLQLMSKGAKYRFVIPAELAYGERAMGDVIPANSTLVFEVELLDFHAPAAPAAPAAK